MTNFFSTVAIAILCLATLLSPSSCSLFAQGEPSAAPTASKAKKKAEAKVLLKKAIAVLCPGGIPAGSVRQKKIEVAIDQFLSGKFPQALETLKALNAADPETPPAKFLLAGFWFALGDSARGNAIMELNAIEHADYPGVYLSFAQLAVNSGRISDAELNAEKAQRTIKQNDLPAVWREHFIMQYYEIMTNVHLRRQQTDEADEALDRLQKVKPDLPFYFLSKAKLKFNAGLQSEAIRFLDQHAKVTNSKQMPELTLIAWLRDQGQPIKARELLLNTIESHPDDLQTLMMAAEMLLAEEDFAETLTTIARFEKANGGESAKSIDIKARIAFAGLSYGAAAGQFRKLVARDPNNVLNSTLLALSLIESSDADQRKESQQMLQQIVTRMPKNGLAIAALGYAFMKNEETKNAAEAMRRAAPARQKSSEVSWFLANWLAEKGQNKEAIELLKNVVEVKGFFLYRSAARKLLDKLAG